MQNQNPFSAIKRDYIQQSVDTSEEDNPFSLIKRKKDIPESNSVSPSIPLPGIGGAIGSTLGVDMGTVEGIASRIKSIGDIGTAIFKHVTGNPVTENQQKLIDTTLEGQKNAVIGRINVITDLLSPLSTKNINFGDVMQSIGEFATNLKSGITDWRNMPKVPFHLITSMASDAAHSATGLDMSKEEIVALTPEQVNHAAKATIGNVMAAVMTPVVEEIVTAGMKRAAYKGLGGGAMVNAANPVIEGATFSAPANMMNASQELVSKISGKSIGPIGKIGESILRDATVAAGVGTAQGAVANAGDPSQQAAAFVSALAFAPIGVVTGWYRGVKGREGIKAGIIEQAKEVRDWRNWQEMTNASVDQLEKKTSELMSSDKIEEILAKNSKLPEHVYLKVRREGLNPNRPLNDLDLTNPSVVEAVKNDPTLSPKQKENVLKYGDPNGEFPRGSVEELFPEFEKHLDTVEKEVPIGNTTGVANFRKALLSFALKYNIDENLPQLTSVFKDKYYRKYAPLEMAELDKLNHAVNVEKKILEGQGYNSYDIIDVANERGFFVTNEHGALRIRDIETGDTQITVNSSKEAMDFLENSGKQPNTPEFDMHSNMPSPDLMHSLQPALHPWQEITMPQEFPRSEGIKIGSKFYPDIDRVEPSVRAANVDLSFGDVTGTSAYFEAVDKIFGTNFTRGHRRLEQAHRITLHEVKSELTGVRMRFANKFLERSKITEHELEQMGMAIETKPIAELESMAKETTKELAQHAIKNNVDLGKVLRYRRQVAGIKATAVNQAKKVAKEQYDLDTAAGVDHAQAFEILRQTEASWGTSDYYVKAFHKVIDTFKPDQNFMKANELYDSIDKTPNGTDQMQLVMRLKNAHENPDFYGISKEEFIKKHALRPEQVKGIELIEGLYKHYGDKFGISDLHRIDGYMPHYRAISDLFDDTMKNDLERGIMDPTMRRFVSSMIRTGEVANYSKNPWKNLQSYVRGGIKSDKLYPSLNEEWGIGAETSLRKELQKLKNIDSDYAKSVEYRLDAYSKDISGQASMNRKQAMVIQARILHKFTLDENGKELPLDVMMKKLETPEMVDTMMNLQSAAYLGGVPSLGVRDVVDVAIKYYTKYGKKATWELLRTKVPKETVAARLASGDIVNPEGADIFNPTDNPSLGSKAHQLSREIANRGYDASFQHYFYLRNQAAVYEHTMTRVHSALDKLEKGVYDIDKVHKELGMNGYNDYTKAQFTAFVADKHWSAAARLLAHEEVRDIVGLYTRGNQPPVLNSTGGKLFGHMGSWAMTNRSVIQNILTRGTSEELAQKWARYGIANGIIVGAGYATGLNLGRWLLLPTSLVVTGGPMISAIKAFGTEAQSELGGDDRVTAFTRRAAVSAAKGFIPFSSAASNIIKTADLVQHGDGYGVIKPALQLFGVPVVKNPQNGLDVWIGNTPISWADPTPFNANPFNYKPFNLNPF